MHGKKLSRIPDFNGLISVQDLHLQVRHTGARYGPGSGSAGHQGQSHVEDPDLVSVMSPWISPQH